MNPLLLAALLLAASHAPGGAPDGGSRPLGPAPLPGSVSVRVLGRLHPAAVEVAGAGVVHRAGASGGRLLVDGAPVEGAFSLPAGRWRVSAPGGAQRRYEGAVELRADGDEVEVIVRVALDAYVASVVAAESLAGTPREALRALAVVARSYAVAGQGRHGTHDLCDLAHCQVMRGEAAGVSGEAARAAARDTAGEVLRLPSGAVAAAPFHAACGGHTADPVQAFGGEGTGAAAVADPGCPPATWRASVPAPFLARLAGREIAGRAGARPIPVEELRFVRGSGGWIVQVGDGTSSVGGEAFARALDRALGHGRVRSARFEVRRSGGGDAIELRGSGLGHGAGLCQAGAARRAGEGMDHAAILRHYFPRARLEPAPMVSLPGAGPPAPRWAPLNRTSSR